MAIRTLQKPDYPKAKREALGLLSQFGIEAPPVNPANIARELGLHVYFVRFSKDFNNISGFYDFEENAIYVNADEYALRQTFTIAHELGHSILHKEWVKSGEYRMLLRDGDYEGDDFREKEANCFAANLLVPRFMLDRYYEGTTRAELSRLFAVSVPTIDWRLANEYGIRAKAG